MGYVRSHVPRRTAISNLYRHNPFTEKPVTDEKIMKNQLGNSKEISERHH
jgi:hypothetical protein